MPIELKRGQHINLNKENLQTKKVQVGLGWASKEEKYGLLAKLFKFRELDCDASVILLNEEGKLIDRLHVVYYGNLVSPDGAITHGGDNLDGRGLGDKEQIVIQLDKLSHRVKEIIFVVNLYACENRNQHFGNLKDAYIRITDLTSNREIVNYRLSEEYYGNTALIVAKMKLINNEWRFEAVGDGTNDCSLSRVVDRFR